MNLQLDKTIVVSPKKPPRTYEDSADCYPTKRMSRKDNNCYNVQKNRFQSPPNLPPFYSGLLNKPKSETKSIETQTTSNCVVIKRRDLFSKEAVNCSTTEEV